MWMCNSHFGRRLMSSSCGMIDPVLDAGADLSFHWSDIGGRAMNLSRRIVLAAALGLLALGSASAQAPLRIFDAHLHYNQEPNPFYDLDKVLEIFRRNNVSGILATSRPNKGTHQLWTRRRPACSSCRSSAPTGSAATSRPGSTIRRSGS